MASPLDALVSLLDLEVIEVNIFRGHSPEENAVRVFGGQVAGADVQCLTDAGGRLRGSAQIRRVAVPGNAQNGGEA